MATAIADVSACGLEKHKYNCFWCIVARLLH